MISLYQHQSRPLLIMALAFLALVLGAVRTLAIIYSLMERTMVKRFAINSAGLSDDPRWLATTGPIKFLLFLPH